MLPLMLRFVWLQPRRPAEIEELIICRSPYPIASRGSKPRVCSSTSLCLAPGAVDSPGMPKIAAANVGSERSSLNVDVLHLHDMTRIFTSI